MVDLGLKSTLTEYKVPKEDLSHIAELSLGTAGHPMHGKVVSAQG